MALKRRTFATLVVLAGSLIAGEEPRSRKAEGALQKGREWLRKDLAAILDPKKGEGPVRDPRSLPQGTRQTLLASLALVHAGLPPSDPLIQRSWKDLQREKPFGTYETGVALLFCEALLSKGKDGGPDPEEIRAWVRPAAESLAQAGRRGAWGYQRGGYEARRGPEGKEYRVDGGARIGSEALRKHVSGAQGDLSNSQYAVLGLKAASLCGVRPEGADALWRAVAQVLIDAQERSGPAVTLRLEGKGNGEGLDYARPLKAKARGWAYASNPDGKAAVQAYGSMTCAGVGCLAIARSEIGDLDAKEREAIDEAIRDGLAWCARHFSVERNPYPHVGEQPGEGAWLFYYLYGLERAGVLCGVDQLGAKDWYEEGCRRLIPLQKGDGAWPAGTEGDSMVRTSFALLFLARATSRRFAQRYHLGTAEPRPEEDPEEASSPPPQAAEALPEDPPESVEPLAPPDSGR